MVRTWHNRRVQQSFAEWISSACSQDRKMAVHKDVYKQQSWLTSEYLRIKETRNYPVTAPNNFQQCWQSIDKLSPDIQTMLGVKCRIKKNKKENRTASWEKLNRKRLESGPAQCRGWQATLQCVCVAHELRMVFIYVKWKLLSHVWLFATPWTIQSMEFSRPEYWSG